jgi:hypothetical protein
MEGLAAHMLQRPVSLAAAALQGWQACCAAAGWRLGVAPEAAYLVDPSKTCTAVKGTAACPYVYRTTCLSCII